MAFPTVTYTDNESAGAALTNNAVAAGLDVSGLQPLAQLQSIVANLLVSDPTTINIPAGDVLSGTFGANKTGGADTGTYTFPGALVVTTTVALTGLTFTTRLTSVTAQATPAALTVLTGTLFASTVSGATVMGFGSTGDVTLKNRAGTDVLVVTANTTGVTMAGALAITGALSGATTVAASTSVTVTGASVNALAIGLAGATNPAFNVDASTASQVAGLNVIGAATGGTVAVVVTDAGSNANLTVNAKGSGTIGIGSVSTGAVTVTPATTITGAVTINNTVQLGAAASANLITIGGTGYGAAGPSIRLNGLTTAATANQVGTLTNAPSAGNPAFWFPISIAGSVRYVPCWS